jgi:hypothetical protein
MALFALCLLFVSLLGAGKRDGWLPLFDSFYRTGSLVFGGGHVVLPLLQAEVVPRDWWTTALSWQDTPSLRRCQVHCFLLPLISGPPRAVLPTVG